MVLNWEPNARLWLEQIVISSSRNTYGSYHDNTTSRRIPIFYDQHRIKCHMLHCRIKDLLLFWIFFFLYYSKIHIKLEDTNVVIRSGRWKNLRLWSKENDKNTKLSTKHYTENERLSSTKPTMKPGWTQVLRKKSSCWSTSGARRTSIVKNHMASLEYVT